MRLTVLVDNREKSGWASEHGLALMLETPEGQLLFDTVSLAAATKNDAEEVLGLENAEKLEEKLK